MAPTAGTRIGRYTKLNHPNIAQINGFEEREGARASWR
jgi:hypothetical protein